MLVFLLSYLFAAACLITVEFASCQTYRTCTDKRLSALEVWIMELQNNITAISQV